MSSIRSYTQLMLMCLMSECYRGHGKPRLPRWVRTWIPHLTSPNPLKDAEDTGPEATQCSSVGGPSILCQQDADQCHRHQWTWPDQRLLFFSGNFTLISSGPSPLPDSQRFAQGADPIPGHQFGHKNHAGSQGEPFLGPQLHL